MSDLLSDSIKVNTHLDSLFKQSAGKSEIAVKPILTEEVIANVAKKNKNQSKKEEKKAFLGFQKAKQLISAENKRKAEALEAETNKKQKKVLTPEEVADKEARTVFEGYKQLKSRFRDSGKIESIRFRSIAFSEPLDRKSAFIARKLHSERDVLNAYIVYSKQEEAKAACQFNGIVFMDKHLRVDLANNDKQHDRKRSVFLGGLPFDIEDEELWEFFKECGDIEFVRTIKDAKTNVGKGFGYVQFKEREAVEAALELTEKKLRDKTKIRVQRCKIPVSEGGVRDTHKKNKSKLVQKKGAKPVNKRRESGKSGKLIPKAKQLEGARASKEDGRKFKLLKSFKKKPTKKSGKKQ
ncbi:Nucleolar protein 12 [Choanephora cucurbitarum]|uniref:Nucleolar protein 12 n=1 Tax=Choanephora cucurbitarum TaxID=101091 RepID=A0A1C7NCT3_9FUNG|nr:Nucleolar protein 12 [Choanephora cucurbitarum]